MLQQPNEAPLSRREVVIRANVSADDRWNAKTSISTSPPHRQRVCVCVYVCEGGKTKCVRNERVENVLVEERTLLKNKHQRVNT